MAVPKQRMDLFSTKLLKVAERAKRDPEARFNAVAHLIDRHALERAYRRLRDGAAVGVDGTTKETYGAELQENLRDLHRRLRAKQWRHQPIRRVHIPKGKGRTRPIGISSTEDKIVQNALGEMLGLLYEPLFAEESHGFRPGRRAHGAVRTLHREAFRGRLNWVVEADIQAFFDSIDRKMLMEMLRNRVTDGSFLRLVGKCLHVGVLDGAEYSEPDEGTPQGSTLSPILGNIYLHYALDLWFEETVRPRLHGRGTLVRYADDFVMGFEREEDARRVLKVLGKRLERFGLTLHPDKTRLVDFRRPKTLEGKGQGTFDFVGFTFYWGRSKKGARVPKVKTRMASSRRFIRTVYDWCRRHRHLPVVEQHAALSRRLQGHFNYFAVNGNFRALRAVKRRTIRVWFKWLNRRSQRSRLKWNRMEDLLKALPLPRERIRIQIWGRS